MDWDCRACGACCHGIDVWLSEADAERFEGQARLRRLTQLRRDGTQALRFLKRAGPQDRCVALAGGLQHCRCTIYAERPGLCRRFEAGTPECLEARKRMGLP